MKGYISNSFIIFGTLVNIFQVKNPSHRAEKPYSSSRRIIFRTRRSTVSSSSSLFVPLISIFLASISRWHLLQPTQATLKRWKLRRTGYLGLPEANGDILSRAKEAKLSVGHPRSRSFNLVWRKLISIQ